MSPLTLAPADREQVLRYMGTPPDRADESLRDTVTRADAAVRDAARPRWLSRVCAITHEPEGIRLDCGLLLDGEDIKSHLDGCTRVVILCATLGAEVDRLIRAAQHTDLLTALAADCCASALIEQLCDRAEEEVQAAFPGCHFPYRYSPGYGDLPIALNGSLLELLDAPRRLGLCVTASGLLIPRKSVTAILGVADHPIDNHKRSCLGCPAQDGCVHRKTGGHCGIS